MELTHGSLFAGIGGFDLGFERVGFKTIWQVEIDPYCLKVLEKNFPHAKRYTDVRFVHGVLAHTNSSGSRSQDRNALHEGRPASEAGRASLSQDSQREDGLAVGDTRPAGQNGCANCLPHVTVLTGGFPCQPFSVAGKRRGTTDDRNLWPEMRRIIEEVRPRWVVAENVPGIIKLAFDQVLSDLEALGYTTGAVTIPACAVDAPHRRERLWIVANAECGGCRTGREYRGLEEISGRGTDQPMPTQESSASVADAKRAKQSRFWAKSNWQSNGLANSGWWLPEPDVGRVVDGISTELDATRRRLGYAEMDDSEAVAAIDQFRREVLRELWHAATTKHKTCSPSCLSELGRRNANKRWHGTELTDLNASATPSSHLSPTAQHDLFKQIEVVFPNTERLP